MDGLGKSSPRPGRRRVLLILIAAFFVLAISIAGMATREPSNEYELVAGSGDSQRIFGGVRQLDDRLGEDGAPVQIQLFLDAQSETYRDQFLETVPPLVNSQVRRGEVKLLYRNRSLTRNATQLSFFGIEAAQNQGYGWQFAYLMFRNQDKAKQDGLDEEFLETIAEAIPNLEIPEWKEDFEAGLDPKSAMTTSLEDQDKLAIDLEVRDQPAAVVTGPDGTEVVQDAPDLGRLQQAIDSVR
ncbi:MAG: DsbA family protein [Acidobacteriota bacterium]